MPPTPSPPTTLAHRPYTASQLSRLSHFILHAPHDTLTALRTLSSPLPLPISPSSHNLNPTPSLTQTCQTILQILNSPPAGTSPSTIPLALILLVRYRSALQHAPTRTPTPTETDTNMLIAILVYISFKFLREGGVGSARPSLESNKRIQCVQFDALSHWCWTLGMNKRKLAEMESDILKVLEWRVWVQDDEFEGLQGRLWEVWEGTLKDGERTKLPEGWKGMGRQV